MAKLVGAMAFLSPVLGFSRLPSTLFVGRRVSVSSMASRADEIAKNLADNGLVLPPPGAPKVRRGANAELSNLDFSCEIYCVGNGLPRRTTISCPAMAISCT